MIKRALEELEDYFKDANKIPRYVAEVKKIQESGLNIGAFNAEECLTIFRDLVLTIAIGKDEMN